MKITKKWEFNYRPEIGFCIEKIIALNVLYFALYWFEQVSAEKHVDVIYAVNDLMDVALGFDIEELPIVFKRVMGWLKGEREEDDEKAIRKKRSDGFMENMMMISMNSDMMQKKSIGCDCDPMAIDFTFKGKMEMMMEMMMNGTGSGTGTGTGTGTGSEESGSPTGMEKECHKPIMPNEDVFNKDGTVRPKNNPSVCAATKSLKKKAAIFWVDCEMGKNMSYYMNFTAEFHSTMSEEAMKASLSFNGEANYKIPEREEDRFPICTIRSNDHHDRCWTIKSLKKATGRSSPVYLKKCEPERLVGRQLWVIEGGSIMLVDNKMKLAKNDKWRSYAGIPYLGVGQKLKTRRI